MENERDFLIIENLTQEEINESFEKLKKNLLRTFYEFRKRKNTDVKILDINYSTEKFIKINIDGIFFIEGKYTKENSYTIDKAFLTKEYSFDMEKRLKASNTELIDVVFHNPVTNINTVFDLVISDIKEFTKNSVLVYKDVSDINIIDDFVKFMKEYFQLFLNTYSLLEFNCLYIKKYGRIVQVIGENISEMGENYKLTSSIDFTSSENRKRFYSIEEILNIKFLEKISYEDLEKQYNEFIIEKM